LGLNSQANSLFDTIFSNFHWISVLDILIVATLFYLFYTFIRGTRAVQIIYGIFVLVIIWAIAKVLQLNVLMFILQYSLTALVVAIPIVFQPELRNALIKLGRTKFAGGFLTLRRRELEEAIEIIVESCEILSRQKTGALIVLARFDHLREHLERGKTLNAELSTELLLNIFSPKAPLHDGAVIIAGNKIKAAGAVLPLSDSKFDYHLGTRHRAAIGLSSISDSIVIVVSEESGKISMAIDSVLETDLKPEQLRNKLKSILSIKKNG